jgi:hypothetical protein
VKSFEIDPGRTSVASAVNGFLASMSAKTEDRTIALHHDDDRATAIVLIDPLRHQRGDHVGDIGRRQLKRRLRHRRIRDGARRVRTKAADRAKRKRPATWREFMKTYP